MRPLALSLVILFAVLLGAYGFLHSVPHEASAILKACSGTSYPPTCYGEEILKRTDSGLSLEDSFTLLTRVQESAPEYFYCHALGHMIAAREVAKDPSAWTSVLSRCPVGVCSNGCLHGAAQERFRSDAPSADDLDASLPELARACDDTATHVFTGLERRECRHGIGHLALYLTSGEVKEALGVCAAVTEGEIIEHKRACDEGVFMQLTRPLEPEDVALSKDTAPKSLIEAKRLCAPLTGAERSACDTDARAFIEWPSRIPTPGEIDALCDEGPTDWNDRCHTDLMGMVGAQFSYDFEKLASYCDGASEERQEQCFGDLAFGALFSDRTLTEEVTAFCRDADERGLGRRCYRTLIFFSAYGFLPDSKEALGFCALLPSPWRDSCEKGDGAPLVSAILSLPKQ